LVLPDPAGTGQAPQSLANAASDLTLSVLSPAVMSISAAVSNPTPNRSSIWGAVAVTS